ncbi:MAG TPA: hypothetical protein VLQ45_11190 [Thermoanaerobaculia bacterium]|nr:hypothetical protein [Thermoanaerobaculia bacterium]
MSSRNLRRALPAAALVAGLCLPLGVAEARPLGGEGEAVGVRVGRTGELKRLAEELVPVFEARDIHREALAALLLFQRACEEERMTVEIARQVAERVRRRGEGVGG